MTQSTERLSSALADRYQIQSRLGEGGMACQRWQRRAAGAAGAVGYQLSAHSP